MTDLATTEIWSYSAESTRPKFGWIHSHSNLDVYGCNRNLALLSQFRKSHSQPKFVCIRSSQFRMKFGRLVHVRVNTRINLAPFGRVGCGQILAIFDSVSLGQNLALFDQIWQSQPRTKFGRIRLVQKLAIFSRVSLGRNSVEFSRIGPNPNLARRPRPKFGRMHTSQSRKKYGRIRPNSTRSAPVKIWQCQPWTKFGCNWTKLALNSAEFSRVSPIKIWLSRL